LPEGPIIAHVSIDPERCKGCQLCLSVCPKKTIGLASVPNQGGYIVAVSLNGKTAPCSGCLACTDVCPDSAISVYRRRQAKPGKID
jgi:2-oxoglutarate ferredoxin oxidoreductase subunit delta